MASKGPGGARCRLPARQIARLEAELTAGPAVHGWDEDQRWRLARIAELIGRLFGVVYTPAGMDVLLHRIGWSVQVPARRAAERDHRQVTGWTDRQWPRIKGSGRVGRLALLRGPDRSRG